MNIFGWGKSSLDTSNSNTSNSNIPSTSSHTSNVSSPVSNIDFPELPEPDDLIRDPSLALDALIELEKVEMLIKKEPVEQNLKSFDKNSSEIVLISSDEEDIQPARNAFHNSFTDLAEVTDGIPELEGPAEFTRFLKVDEVRICSIGMDYPPTSPGGIGLVIPRYINDKEHDSWNYIQYSKIEGRGGTTCHVPYFNNQRFTHEVRKCGGVRTCEYVRPDIKNLTHTSVEPNVQFYIQGAEVNSPLQMTFAWYLEQRKKPECPCERTSYYDEEGYSQLPQKCDGKFALKKRPSMPEPGSKNSHYYIGCTKWTWEDYRNNKKHRYITIPVHIDIDVLGNLIDGETSGQSNMDPIEHYLHIFDTLSEVFREHTNVYPAWQHIHGEGWAYVLADMDHAQAKGLGMHLQKIDSTKTVDEHLQHVLVSCLVHFHRALHSKHFPEEVEKLIGEIPYIEEKSEIDQIFDQLRERSDKAIKDWLEFYSQPWLLSSLSPVYTKVQPQIFSHLNRSTNASESNHANANRSGKHLSLHAVIFSRMSFDRARWGIAEVHQISGIVPSNKSSIRQRAATMVKAEHKRTKKRHSKEQTAGNPSKRITKREHSTLDTATTDSGQRLLLVEKQIEHEKLQQETLRLRLKLCEQEGKERP